MKLARMDLRDFFFRNRGYTPIPLALAILYFADKEESMLLQGVILAIVGELVRINGVRYAGLGTRTRKVGAKSLCTSGPFAYVRNPLYLSNMMIYSGMILIAGGKQVWVMLAVAFLFFAIQYGLIILLEEEILDKIFGEQYKRYRKAVPRLIPRLNRWRGGDEKKPSPLLKALKSEKRTLQTIVIFLLFLIIRIHLFS